MIKGLPERLKKLRTQMNLSQKYVADQLKVSPSIISAYETGERTPSTENILLLSYLFKCSTDYLLGKDKEKPSAVLSVEGLSNAQISAVIGVIRAFREQEN